MFKGISEACSWQQARGPSPSPSHLSLCEAVHITDRLRGQLGQRAAAQPAAFLLVCASQVRRARYRCVRHDQSIHLQKNKMQQGRRSRRGQRGLDVIQLSRVSRSGEGGYRIPTKFSIYKRKSCLLEVFIEVAIWPCLQMTLTITFTQPSPN